MRHFLYAALWLTGALVTFSAPIAAPIPKGATAKPVKLTKELLVGT